MWKCVSLPLLISDDIFFCIIVLVSCVHWTLDNFNWSLIKSLSVCTSNRGNTSWRGEERTDLCVINCWKQHVFRKGHSANINYEKAKTLLPVTNMLCYTVQHLFLIPTNKRSNKQVTEDFWKRWKLLNWLRNSSVTPRKWQIFMIRIKSGQDSNRVPRGKKPTKNLSQNMRSLDRDLNRNFLEYEAGTLTTDIPYLFIYLVIIN